MVAEICCHLVFHHAGPSSDSASPPSPSPLPSMLEEGIPKLFDDRDHSIHAAKQMGVVLQLVNIARDIEIDAVKDVGDGFEVRRATVPKWRRLWIAW